MKGRTKNNTQCRAVLRSAFRTYLKEEYLAKAFLKYPRTSLTHISSMWGDYVDSSEYHRELDKKLGRLQTAACAPPAERPEPVACPPPAEEPTTLKQQLDTLRNMRKQALKGRADDATNAYFTSGELDKDLAKLTKENGAGRYYNESGVAVDLRPYAFGDFVLSHARQ
jgi:hypothetical protein